MNNPITNPIKKQKHRNAYGKPYKNKNPPEKLPEHLTTTYQNQTNQELTNT